MTHIFLIICYIVVMNIAGLVVMGLDKARAKRHAFRISEKGLFLVSLLGGSVGTWAGMYLFRHKTRHWYFVVGMPLILLLQIILCIYLCNYFWGVSLL